MRIIITDCHYKMSLALVRSLRRAGYEVVCCESDRFPEKAWLGSRSRDCSKSFAWAASGEPAAAIAAQCQPGDVILPVGRATLASFGAHPELAEQASFLASPPEVLDRADDKALVWELARSLDIPVPETVTMSAETGLILPKTYPCILKYVNGEAMGLHAQERCRVVNSPEELRAAYTAMAARSGNLLCQEYLRGPDLGVALVMDRDSRLVDCFCYESQREYPLSGGPSCLCTTAFDRDLVRYGCRLLRALNFTGVAMMDFKGTGDGPRLLEINPRIWGSAALAELSGGTLFDSWVKAALGTAEPIDPETCTPAYRLGVPMKFVPQLYVAALAELRQGQLHAGLRDFRSALSPRVRDGVFRKCDPAPFFRYFANQLRGVNPA